MYILPKFDYEDAFIYTGDVCDPDDDDDGVYDLIDNCQYDYNRDQSDIDSDGIGKCEMSYTAIHCIITHHYTFKLKSNSLKICNNQQINLVRQ